MHDQGKRVSCEKLSMSSQALIVRQISVRWQPKRITIEQVRHLIEKTAQPSVNINQPSARTAAVFGLTTTIIIHRLLVCPTHVHFGSTFIHLA